MKKIPYGKHFIDEADIEAVVDVLRNGQLTQGPKILEFEKKFASYVNCKYAVAVSSCTAGLHSFNSCRLKKTTHYNISDYFCGFVQCCFVCRS